MTSEEMNEIYFDWLYFKVTYQQFHRNITYRRLLGYLHDTDFRYSIPRDENRAFDGIDMRYRFAIDQDYEDYPHGACPPEGDVYAMDLLEHKPCSVLEMLYGLAVRCEESIMDDPRYGDRTNQWFWGMVNNLGLSKFDDNSFDVKKVANIVNRFLDREYGPDGRGGLFTVRNCEEDLRDQEIWYQLHRYLSSIR